MRRSLLVACVLPAVFGCQCDDELGDVPGTISGIACNDDGGQPLPSAVVRIEGATSTTVATAADGRYKATVPPGTYTVSVDIPAGEPGGERTREIGSGDVKSSEDTAIEDTSCRPPPTVPDGGNLRGAICNRHVGSLVAGGRVIAKIGTFEKETTTDDQGQFLLEELPEGEGTVTVIAPGFQRTFPIEIVEGETFEIDLDDNCDLNTTSTGCVIASICDPALGPNSDLVGADVTVRLVSAGADEAVEEITDTEGFFEVCGLVPGSYEVRVRKGSVDATEIVVVEAGETTTVVGPSACDNRTQVGRLEGSVCNEGEGGGVFIGSVELRQGAANGPRVGDPVTTDASGEFVFINLAPGSYFVAFPNNPELAPIGPVEVIAFQTTPLEARNCPLPDDVCTPFQHTPESTSDGRVFFIVDKSGSMRQPATGFGGSDKWDSLKDAVEAVTTTFQGAANIDYALVAYPDPRAVDVEDACTAGTQQVAMGGSGAQINSSLNGINPFGGTPTAATLENVRGTIETLAVIDRPLAVVLATDGAPNCADTRGLADVQCTSPAQCDGSQCIGGFCDFKINCTLTQGSVCTSNVDGQTDTSCAPFNCLDLNAVNQVREIAGLGVDVHVIGIRGSDENASFFTNALNQMAVAGGAPLPAGSPTRFHDATNTQALEDALAAVTRRIVACNITTPFNLEDATSVSVSIGGSPILQNTSHTNGWDITGPNTIELFGGACDRATETEAPITVERCVPGG